VAEQALVQLELQISKLHIFLPPAGLSAKKYCNTRGTWQQGPQNSKLKVFLAAYLQQTNFKFNITHSCTGSLHESRPSKWEAKTILWYCIRPTQFNFLTWRKLFYGKTTELSTEITPQITLWTVKGLLWISTLYARQRHVLNKCPCPFTDRAPVSEWFVLAVKPVNPKPSTVKSTNWG